nr:immunoglobulin light chain junction region [Macaca mulatta]
CQYSYDIPYTF